MSVGPNDPRRPKRLKKPVGEQLTQVIQFRVSEEERQRIAVYCRARGMTPSSFTRILVLNQIAEE